MPPVQSDYFISSVNIGLLVEIIKDWHNDFSLLMPIPLKAEVLQYYL